MKKIIMVLIALIYIALNVNASCGAPDECEIDITNVTEKLHSGDEITVTIEFKNVGSKRCCYQATLYDESGKPWESEPDVLWEGVEPGKEGTITLTSDWDWEWDACELASALGPGIGRYTVILTGVSGTGSAFDVCAMAFVLGDDCEFLGDAVTRTFSPLPPGCCGKFEGTACLDYGTAYGGFTCDSIVQVNAGVPCLVECRYDDSINSCSCALIDACATACVREEKSYCTYDYFMCMGNYYKCANGDEPEVRCSTTRDCRYQCAAECGKRTTCMNNCEACCNSAIACSRTNPIPYGDDEREVCNDACMGICRANEELCNIIRIAQGVAVASAILLIMVQGMKWMVSDDLEGRQDAKSGIGYVFLGLVLALLSTLLASYFFSGSLIC